MFGIFCHEFQTSATTLHQFKTDATVVEEAAFWPLCAPVTCQQVLLLKLTDTPAEIHL